jgi:hypothetical protein
VSLVDDKLPPTSELLFTVRTALVPPLILLFFLFETEPGRIRIPNTISDVSIRTVTLVTVRTGTSYVIGTGSLASPLLTSLEPHFLKEGIF